MTGTAHGIGYLAAWLALLAAGIPASADTVTLKDHVYIRGPEVLLGDVAEITGADAQYLKTIPIGLAALPGGVKRLNAALVRARLRQGGVEDAEVEVRGARNVLATTLHLDVTRGMIAEALRDYVRQAMPWSPDTATVEVAPPARDYVVSDGEVDVRWRPNPQYRYLGTGSFRGEILVNGQVEKSFYAKATVLAYEAVAVASRAIARGEPIGASNVRLESRELSTLRGEAFFSVNDVIGHVAKSSILAGQVITQSKAVLPLVVKRNQMIPVETAIGALVIRGRARALSNAAVGDLIRAMNPGSKEEFMGIVRGDGVLVVE